MLRTATGGVIRILLVALGCAQAGAARADEIAVVASIKPVHALVAAVMAGVGTPGLLVKGASSPHDYSLRPSDARALDGAQVVFWVGDGLETFLGKPLAALAGDARVVALSAAPGVELLPTREGGIWEGHDQVAAEAEGAEAEHADARAHGQLDMHVWLDPHAAAAMAHAIVAALSAADPDHAAVYQRNGGELRAQLEDLDRSLGARLEPVADRPFVVFHDAYHYLESRYGLNALGAIAVDPRRRPGARRLAEIRDRLQELDAACVFAEPQFEPALVDTVIEGTGASKGVLDPLGAALDAGPDHYFRLMDNLAAALTGCLGAARSG
jgi:zinc transport system substrate-binding protein